MNKNIFSYKLFFVIAFVLVTHLSYAQTYKAFVNQGEKSFLDGDYYSAKNYFQKAMEFESADLEVTYKAAESSRLFNDYYSAIVYYNQTIKDDKEKKFPLAIFWLAAMNKMTADYESAKNLFIQYYTLHSADSNYFSLKSKQEINDCTTAINMMKDTLPVEVQNLGNRINSVYSDFAGQMVKDSILYYSSLRFQGKDSKNKKTKNYISKILATRTADSSLRSPIPLDTIFNHSDLHDCNATFSADNKLMIFTRCSNINFSDIRCELYESKNIKGKWSYPIRLNDSINLPNYTSTQPCIATNGAEGYILFFVSDRTGGYGKLDIYKSFILANGQYNNPVNAGPEINSSDEDITPFFHNPTQTLYFSSNGHSGLGGYDIFKSKMLNSNFSTAENIGYPLNTSYHDLYFNLSENSEKGLLSSNRPGSMYIKSKTCCYDIYAFSFIKHKKDTDFAVAVDTGTFSKISTDTLTGILAAKQLLPLELYFHNDEPDPRTEKSTTKANYFNLYTNYIELKKEYENKFAANLSIDERSKAIKNVDLFFDETVTVNFNRLEKFSLLLAEELKAGKKITITVRGFTSPLAKSRYNILLSKRRISSFVNYLKAFENGIINKYIANKLLLVIEDPAGESYVKQGVSDDLNDKKNSVYNPSAAAERKIQVIDVEINN